MNISIDAKNSVFIAQDVSEVVALHFIDSFSARVIGEKEEEKVEEETKVEEVKVEEKCESSEPTHTPPGRKIKELVNSAIPLSAELEEPESEAEKIMKELQESKPKNKITGLDSLLDAGLLGADYDTSLLTAGGDPVFGPKFYGRLTEGGTLLLRASYTCGHCGHTGFRYLTPTSTYARCHDCDARTTVHDASEYGIDISHDGELINIPEAVDGVHLKTI